MDNPVIRRLEHFLPLDEAEKAALHALTQDHIRELTPREDLVLEGEPPRHVNLVLAGCACRYKMLEDGRRQIVAFFVPGDLCDARVFILKSMDHSIAAIAQTTVAQVPPERFIALTDRFPRLTRALWWNTLVHEAIAREWILNIGQRSALERMANLLCELFMRLRAVDMTRGEACDLPLTQADLGEALGISTVHVNRTLQTLRADGLISFKGGVLEVHDLPALADLAMFNPNYLHLERGEAAATARALATT
ncbi:MAG: cyclic nucleotide-binding protein [Phenylobacterium zucineum]|nr:MAG: cyclic nucleotide-binding protein [Phenylobacterium zucineum]